MFVNQAGLNPGLIDAAAVVGWSLCVCGYTVCMTTVLRNGSFAQWPLVAMLAKFI